MTITRNDNGTMRFSVSYSARMLTDVNGIIADVREAMSGIKYDTIVGRGTSGMLIVPIVARALRKNYLIIRKDEERAVSHSEGVRYMGTLGKRWIFLDDFCSSGNTFRKVRDAVKDAVREVNAMVRYEPIPGETDMYGFPKSREVPYSDKFETELVGFYEYNAGMRYGTSGFTPWNDSEDLSRGSFWDDCPFDVRQREIREEIREEKRAELAEKAIPGDVGVLNGGLFNLGESATCLVGNPNCNCKAELSFKKDEVKV